MKCLDAKYYSDVSTSAQKFHSDVMLVNSLSAYMVLGSPKILCSYINEHVIGQLSETL